LGAAKTEPTIKPGGGIMVVVKRWIVNGMGLSIEKNAGYMERVIFHRRD